MDLSLTIGHTLLRFRLSAGGIAVLVLAATVAVVWDNILHDGVISGWIEVFCRTAPAVPSERGLGVSTDLVASVILELNLRELGLIVSTLCGLVAPSYWLVCLIVFATVCVVYGGAILGAHQREEPPRQYRGQPKRLARG